MFPLRNTRASLSDAHILARNVRVLAWNAHILAWNAHILAWNVHILDENVRILAWDARVLDENARVLDENARVPASESRNFASVSFVLFQFPRFAGETVRVESVGLFGTTERRRARAFLMRALNFFH